MVGPVVGIYEAYGTLSDPKSSTSDRVFAIVAILPTGDIFRILAHTKIVQAGVRVAEQVAGNAARGATSAAKVFSKEKQALIDMAKADKRVGVTREDMRAYEELNRGLPDPLPANKVRVDEGHIRGAPHSQVPHGHVGPVDYIPIVGP